MSSLPLADVRQRLSEIVTEIERTHERITLTKHGRAAAVLVAVDDLEALEETVDLLSTPSAVEEIRQAQREIDAGDYVGADELARRFLHAE